MAKLPVIVGTGGINPAGRTSFHHAYRRMVIDSLPSRAAEETLANLAVLMGLISYQETGWCSTQGHGEDLDLPSYLRENRDSILSSTGIRELEKGLFDPEQMQQHQKVRLSAAQGDSLSFTLSRRNLPRHIPDNWRISEDDAGSAKVRVEVLGELNALLKDTFASPVKAAGQLPSGFAPDRLYPSRNHPRGLQMAIYAASDAIHSLGIDWDTVMRRIAPDQLAVYAASSMGQLDYNGSGGMLQARLLGKKVTSKQLALGFAEMPADFINAYVLGNLGTTSASLGACATFHYNLYQAIRDIQSGTHRVAIVGGSEAPLVPEVIEGYANMGALADDEKLRILDGLAPGSRPDYRRASRPFGENVGFTLGESAQFIVLFDDALALELGANIYGAVNEVFINADGHKKSIAGPGVGNYITVAKAAAATRAVIGEEGLRQRTYVQAHGTSTPQNRVTESAIFRDIAGHFGIRNWPVTAIKAYLGHSLGCAGADQLTCSLGVWQYGVIPGIETTQAVAEDVTQDNLDFLLQHREVGANGMDAVLLNAKGFGGNNSTASILSPEVTRRMLESKHGGKAMSTYQTRNEGVAETAQTYNNRTCREEVPPIYKYDYQVRDGASLDFNGEELRIEGLDQPINLALRSRYQDMDE